VLVVAVAQVGAVFKLRLQVGVKLGWSSWGVQVGVFKLVCLSRWEQVGCCEFLVSTFRWRKPPHHVKVNPLGEVLYYYFIASLRWIRLTLIQGIGFKEVIK
jgi:hypothetical protein